MFGFCSVLFRSVPRSSLAVQSLTPQCLGWSSHRLRKSFLSTAHLSTSATVRFLSVHSRYRSIRGFAYAAPYHAKANHCRTVPLPVLTLLRRCLCFTQLYPVLRSYAVAVLRYTPCGAVPLPCPASRCLGCAALFWAVLSLCSSCSSLPLPVGAHLSCSTAVLLIALPLLRYS